MDLGRQMFDDGERKTLTDLQAANLARCTPEAIGVAFTVNAEHVGNPEAEAAQRDAMARLADYLRAFVAPGPCVKCGATLGGSEKNLLGAMFGTFEWGLAHGEGRCGRCKYPARGIHYIAIDGEGGEVTLPRILQYHPADLAEREPSPAATAPEPSAATPTTSSEPETLP